MSATDILVEEHNIILKVLECLEAMVGEAETAGSLDQEAATRAIDFFRNFADKTHHAKEEDRLFIAMEEHGFPRQGGPTGVMLMEHEEGREFIRGMAGAVEDAAAGDPQALATFCNNARHFTGLLSQHIQKENQVLFPMATQTLQASTQASLLAAFREIEKSAGGDRHAKYLGMARELCARYNIPFLADTELRLLRKEFLE